MLARARSRADVWGVWGAWGRRGLCTAAAEAETGGEEGGRVRRRWDTRERRRAFLLEAGERLGVGAGGRRWANVRGREVRALGGTALLNRYGGSLFAALEDLLPEAGVGAQTSGKKPRGYWRRPGAARAFLEALAREHGVRAPEDWARVSSTDVAAAGGSGLLRLHGYRMASLLAAELPELAAAGASTRPRRAAGEWRSPERRREFVRKLAAELGVRAPEDWKAVTVEEVRRRGGAGLLRETGGLLPALQEAFPEQGLTAHNCRARVAPAHWRCPRARREFLDEVATAHGVRAPEDWRRVRTEDIVAMGGKALLRRFPTSYAMLCDAYPELEIDGRLVRPTAPVGHWRSEENIKAFVEEVASRFQPGSQEDWYRISLRQLKEVGNPFHVIRWIDALRIAFPNQTWEEEKVSAKTKRTTQRHLFQTLAAIFPVARQQPQAASA